MRSGYVFPYGITLREGGKVDTFPVAEISFPFRGGGRLALFLLIDSGAAISALPKTDARMFGIDVGQGIPMFISGIDGRIIAGWRHEVRVCIKEDTLLLPIVFLDNDFSPRVLGRDGIFDHFTVIFEESRRRSSMIWNTTRESRAVKGILDALNKKE